MGDITRHFSWREFRCHDGTPVPTDLARNVMEVCENLEVLRHALGDVKIHVVSGYRTPSWNEHVGGAKHSQHKLGKAADIQVAGLTPVQLRRRVLDLIEAGKMKQGGVGLYPTFLHYDVRGTGARWEGGRRREG